MVERSPASYVSGRIVEVEAYRGSEDPASHAWRGPTERNRAMFGPPGLLYVYVSYGLHHCCNVVCWPEGVAGAVLVRALEPVAGTAEMAVRRAGGRLDHPALTDERQLCSGPGKLCQALGIGRGDDGLNLLAPDSPVRLESAPADVVAGRGRSISSGPRIGIASDKATAAEPWRWWLTGSRFVSGSVRGAR